MTGLRFLSRSVYSKCYMSFMIAGSEALVEIESSDSKYDTEQLNTDKRADKWDEAVSHQIEQEMKRLNEASERVEQEIKLNRAKQKALLENLTVVSNTDFLPSLLVSSPYYEYILTE